MKTNPVIEQLPDDYLKLIGEIVTAWSLQEATLRGLVFRMLNLDHKRGRTAVRTPRASEMVDMLEELALIAGFTFDASSLEMLDDVERRRNQVAHSVWLMSPNGKPMIQNLQGKWPNSSTGKGVKKRISPEGIEIDPENLTDLVNAIRNLTANTLAVGRAIEKCLKSSPSEPTPANRSPG